MLDRIVDAAWRSGDPGMLYLDAINRANPTPTLGEIETTNPCGEVPLLPWESCTLGSVNLSRLARGAGQMDWNRLRHAVRVGVRFLDNVIEVNRAPLTDIAEAARGSRKIGLGVMGFAECLIRLGVPYDTPEAIDWADRLMAFIATEAREASRELAATRGSFPNWSRSVYARTGEPMRNATRLSVAPTGTITMLGLPGLTRAPRIPGRRVGRAEWPRRWRDDNPLAEEALASCRAPAAGIGRRADACSCAADGERLVLFRAVRRRGRGAHHRATPGASRRARRHHDSGDASPGRSDADRIDPVGTDRVRRQHGVAHARRLHVRSRLSGHGAGTSYRSDLGSASWRANTRSRVCHRSGCSPPNG